MKQKLVFMGSDEIGLPALEALAEAGELIGVYSQPDRPSGRGKKLQANAISAWALDRGIELRRPEKLGDEDVLWLKERGVDLVFVMAYGHILRPAFLAAPTIGCYNLHASLLPKYRGASPIVGAIAMGERETGVTLMEMVSKMDAGAMIDQETVVIDPRDTATEVFVKMAQAAAIVTKRNIQAIFDNNYVAQEQDEAEVSYTRKLIKEDGQMDFTLSPIDFINRLRALQPWPGGFFEYRGELLKVGNCVVLEDECKEEGEFGKIASVSSAGIDVVVNGGLVRILEIQRPGGKLLAVGEFIRGYAIEVGEVLRSYLAKPLVSKEPFPWKK